jgi:hypothetical protein
MLFWEDFACGRMPELAELASMFTKNPAHDTFHPNRDSNSHRRQTSSQVNIARISMQTEYSAPSGSACRNSPSA